MLFFIYAIIGMQVNFTNLFVTNFQIFKMSGNMEIAMAQMFYPSLYTYCWGHRDMNPFHCLDY
jgi:hypothetical protein